MPIAGAGDQGQQDGPSVTPGQIRADDACPGDRETDQRERPLHGCWHAGILGLGSTLREPLAHDGHPIDTPPRWAESRGCSLGGPS
jgi:hypothetical protein